MRGFGASAPFEELARHFRFQAEEIAGAALIGMAAFLAGTIQAPMTCFIIVFEMTNDHHLLLPTMLACLIAVIAARLTGSHHLYKTLASFYHETFPPPAPMAPKA